MKNRELENKNKLLRDAIPKKWIDICELIPLINFKLIEIFYQNEYKAKGTIKTDWKETKELKRFSKWLEAAYKYLKIKRPSLERKVESYLNKLSWEENLVKNPSTNSFSLKSLKGKKGQRQKKILKKIDKFEAKITKKDTKILRDMIRYRKLFWT